MDSSQVELFDAELTQRHDCKCIFLWWWWNSDVLHHCRKENSHIKGWGCPDLACMIYCKFIIIAISTCAINVKSAINKCIHPFATCKEIWSIRLNLAALGACFQVTAFVWGGKPCGGIEGAESWRKRRRNARGFGEAGRQRHVLLEGYNTTTSSILHFVAMKEFWTRHAETISDGWADHLRNFVVIILWVLCLVCLLNTPPPPCKRKKCETFAMWDTAGGSKFFCSHFFNI